MNKDIISGKLMQFRGEILERWGKLTDDEFDQAKGNAEQIAGLIQQRYGIAKDQAKRQLEELMESKQEEPVGVGSR